MEAGLEVSRGQPLHFHAEKEKYCKCKKMTKAQMVTNAMSIEE
jgi:hypothetical protein